MVRGDKREPKQRGSTEQRIVNAALREFSRHGYEGARIDQIAKRAGINKAMIYYHFKGKEKLYVRILTDTFKDIYSNIEGTISDDWDTLENFYSFLEQYIAYIDSIDQDFIRIMLSEISKGGAYFRKIALPNLIVPVIRKLKGFFQKGKKNNLIKDLNPYYTIFQIVGSILFINMLKIALRGTGLEGDVFHGNFREEFKDNLLTIIKSGIEKERGV
jgi:TetR/AcrR family transcriptional regulator